MKAVMKLEAKPKRTELVETEIPQIQEDQVLLKVTAAGVCGSDVDIWNQNVGFVIEPPFIHGHEFCGEILETGARVQHFRKGERVVCETASYICGQCVYCRTGQYNQCPKRLGYGAKINGGFAEYVAVPERILHRIPDQLDDVRASLTEPVCVAYNALIVKSRVYPGMPVVVIGPGTIGLLCVAMARLAGAYPIFAIGRDSSKARLQIAKDLGADVTINSTFEDPVPIVKQWTDGLGAPLTVDCAGSSETFRQSMALTAPNGQITKLGWGPEPLGCSIDSLIQRGIAVQGAFSHTWHTWETVLKLLTAGRIDLTAFTDHVYPLDQWEQAFSAMETREAVKSVLLPNG